MAGLPVVGWILFLAVCGAHCGSDRRAGSLRVGCRLYWLGVERNFDEIRSRDDFYYSASDDDAPAYELKPRFQLERDGRRIAINQSRLRADTGLSRSRLES